MPMNVIVCMLPACYYVGNQTHKELTTGGFVYEPMGKEINTS